MGVTQTPRARKRERDDDDDDERGREVTHVTRAALKLGYVLRFSFYLSFFFFFFLLFEKQTRRKEEETNKRERERERVSFVVEECRRVSRAVEELQGKG